MTGSVHLSASIVVVGPQRLQLNKYIKKLNSFHNDKFSGKSATKTAAAADTFVICVFCPLS